MLKIENHQTYGWEAAIRGMRNPLNSWAKSDSVFTTYGDPCIGTNDLELMKKLRNAGTDHRKFMRMIMVFCDIIAPRYWWAEFDTYKVGTVRNSCSTMHKLMSRHLTIDDFSLDDNVIRVEDFEDHIIKPINNCIDIYKNFDDLMKKGAIADDITKELLFRSAVQLLPSGFNQRATVTLNYEVLANIYRSRKNHKLSEWHTFCDWIKTLPYSELITGEVDE